jgi:cysteinyl-tRNA synthetase
VAAALDDDLNAPQAVAALFDAVRDGNRLLDQGEAPTGQAVAGWSRVIDILDVLPAGGGGATLSRGEGEVAAGDLSETPPAESAAQEAWALAWARARLAAKSGRDYKEADRVRDLLRAHGWTIRDNKDGTVEVRRA